MEVTGVTLLAGLGSGNPRATERFGATTRTMFDARAPAIIRPTGPGATESTLTADGPEPVVFRLEGVAA